MRQLRIVDVPSIAQPITKSPGFAKKLLATRKLDLMGRCGFSCTYCSSTAGNYQRINRGRFADLAADQLGERVAPVAISAEPGRAPAAAEPNLVFRWPDVIERLDAQLDSKPRGWLAGETVVISQLTDAFSNPPLREGVTARALDLFLERTMGRGRILTKNSTVGLSSRWRDFFVAARDRFVVGLSVGSLDDRWAARVEIGTPRPSARLAALRALQDAGVPTYGMLCPVFPDALERLDELVAAIRPELCEHIWAEPYNDRANWRAVRAGYEPSSPGWNWFTHVFKLGGKAEWSSYATELYERLLGLARRDGWAGKLRYLLYEGDIAPEHAPRFAGLEGVLLQSAPGPDGFSGHPGFAALQHVGHGDAQPL